MTFFNKKTEVMKVELTPFGRYKLSIGRLKPHHYRFFDNNVVYDVSAMGTSSTGVVLSEDQNDADHRIRQETPLLKQNPNITGIETMYSIIETENHTVQTNYSQYDEIMEEYYDLDFEELYSSNFRKNMKDDHINKLIYNLGTIEYDARQSPAYQLNAFRGELSSSTSKFYSSPNIQTSSLPQIDLNIEYKISVVYSLETDYSTNLDVEVIGPFDDGSSILIKKENPLLRIKESNAFDEKENFHITAYKAHRPKKVGEHATGVIDFSFINGIPGTDLDSNTVTITINDFDNIVTFQFLSSSTATPEVGNVAVRRADGGGLSSSRSTDYANSFKYHFDQSVLNITAVVSNTRVSLEHNLPGSRNNIPMESTSPSNIIETSKGFSGMEGGTGIEPVFVYEKMDFEKKNMMIVNDLYVGEQGNIQQNQFNTKHVPYFFQILVDKEIAESDYCATIGDLEIRNIYLDEEIICPDQITVENINIYSSNVTGDDLEDCD